MEILQAILNLIYTLLDYINPNFWFASFLLIFIAYLPFPLIDWSVWMFRINNNLLFVLPFLQTFDYFIHMTFFLSTVTFTLFVEGILVFIRLWRALRSLFI